MLQGAYARLQDCKVASFCLLRLNCCFTPTGSLPGVNLGQIGRGCTTFVYLFFCFIQINAYLCAV